MSDHEISSRETNASQLIEDAKPRHPAYPFIDPTDADLTGRSVFITKASRAIGQAAALAYVTTGSSKFALYA